MKWTTLIAVYVRLKQSIFKACAMMVMTSGFKPSVVIANCAHEEIFDYGPMLLQILMPRIAINSRYTVTYIRSILWEMYKHMVKMDEDVTKFNKFVKLELHALRSRGKSSRNIMVNLFKGYKAVTDGQFWQYLSQKKRLLQRWTIQ